MPDNDAQVAELVDAHGSGPCAARCGGSSPLLGTIRLILDDDLTSIIRKIRKLIIWFCSFLVSWHYKIKLLSATILFQCNNSF